MENESVDGLANGVIAKPMRPDATDLTSEKFGKSSSSMLLAILDQSRDCIKILNVDCHLDYMNRNGQCAMEIDDFCAVAGASWSDMWPSDAKAQVDDALNRVRLGEGGVLYRRVSDCKGHSALVGFIGQLV